MSTMSTPSIQTLNLHFPVPEQLRNGLLLLLEARQFAVELDRDAWDFAVEARSLRRAGLSKSTLRWLSLKGYVEHAREITKPGEAGRQFHPDGNLSFSRRSCLILTEEGLRMAAELCESMVQSEFPASADALWQERFPRMATPHWTSSQHPGQHSGGRPLLQAAGPKPIWDGRRHELRVGRELVKIYKLPSQNQETVLMSFEEEGWPPRIDDPLPPRPHIQPKKRLHDTIKNLNRRQKQRLIRFMGDGTGQGVRWELVQDTETSPM